MKGPALIIPGSIFGSIILVFLLLSITAGTTPAAAGTDSLDQASSVNPAGMDNANQADPVTQCQVSPNFPERIRQWCSLITHYAMERSLDPDLVAALIWQESNGNPAAYSRDGAVGLMQVMPKDGIAANFMCVNGPCFKDRPAIAELQDPEFNIAYGTKMLSGLKSRYGSIREGLKSYGPMNVGYYYADKVLGIYQEYRAD